MELLSRLQTDMALQVHCSNNRLGHCIAGGEGGQLTSPMMHAQRRHRNWSRDLASPTAHLNSCTGCSCHCAGMHVLSSAVDSVNMISAISPSSKSTRRCQMLTSLSISPLRSTCASALCCTRRSSLELLFNRCDTSSILFCLATQHLKCSTGMSSDATNL